VPAGHGRKRWRSTLTNPERGYALLYGGTDSDGITERANDFPSMMAGVAQSHALQSSGPIVLREFYLLPQEERRLFAGMDMYLSPVTEFGDTFEIEAGTRSEIEALRLEGQLTAGTIIISLAFLNDFGDEEGDRDVLLDRLTVRRESEEIHQVQMEDHEHPFDCHHIEQNAFHLSGSDSHCVLNVPVDVPSDGTYVIEIHAWADQYGEELARLAIGVESDSLRSLGATRIKGRLVELYDKLHGTRVTAESPQVRDAYDLFVEVWERKRDAHGDGGHFGSSIEIDWPSDQFFLEGVVDDAFVFRDDSDSGVGYFDWDWQRINPYFEKVDWSDPHAVAQTWTVVLAYLMMDYRYLYL